MQIQFVAKNGFEVAKTWGLTVTVTAKPARISSSLFLSSWIGIQERRLA